MQMSGHSLARPSAGGAANAREARRKVHTARYFIASNIVSLDKICRQVKRCRLLKCK